MLAERPRRRGFRLLADIGVDPEPADRRLAVITTDRPGHERRRRSSDPVATALYHAHRPLVAGAGPIEFDRLRSSVRHLRDEEIGRLLTGGSV